MRYFFLFILLSPILLLAQNAQEVYGKNKVQYNRDQQDWWIYETSNFVFYWYGRSKNDAQFCIEISETINTEIQSLFEYHLKDKIEIIVYADHSDAMQSNLAILENISIREWDQEPKVKDQTIRIFFDGAHTEFANELKRGIIKVYFNSMFSGSSFQQVVQKIISYRLPDWFENGLINYLAEGWTRHDLYELNYFWDKNKKFKSFSKNHPDLAGKSFWNFISTNFGKKSISDFLYLSRINKDINRASKIVFQTQFSSLENSWKTFYTKEFENAQLENNNNSIPLKLKKHETINSVQQSQYFNKTIVTTNQLGRLRLRVFNDSLTHSKIRFHHGTKTRFIRPNHYYPIFIENPKADVFGVIYESRNRIYCKFHAKENEMETFKFPEEIQQIYSAKYWRENEIIFSAKGNGFVDIYTIQMKTRALKKITNDIYDDLRIELDQDNNLYFNSNRDTGFILPNKLDNVFPTRHLKLYQLKLDKNDVSINSISSEGNLLQFSIINPNNNIQLSSIMGNKITRITNQSNKYQIKNLSKDNFYYYKSNQLFQIYKNPKGKYFFNKNSNAQYQEIDSSTQITIEANTSLDSSSNKMKITQEKFYSKYGSSSIKDKILEEIYTSKSKIIPTQKFDNLHSVETIYPDLHQYNSSLAIAYRDRFKLEEITYDVNNDILFSGLNTYSGFQKDYNTPTTGLLFKARVKENFENYWIECGIRVPFDFKGSEAFLLFENNKRKLDHSFGLYRKYIKENIPSNNLLATNTFIANYQLKYPLDHYKSLRLNNTFRNDHSFLLLTEKSLIDTIGTYHQRIGTRIEYVFDNLFNYSININDGWQSKLFFEISKRININDNFKNFSLNDGYLMLLGLDSRYHKNIFKRSSWSSRFYISSSVGKEKILYSLGATENWLFPKYSQAANQSLEENYAYHALATEVRGHFIGSRKGTSVAGLSTELRIPFLQYLLNSSWKNSFFRNLQLVGFFDAGMTWNGVLPKWKQIGTQVHRAENNSVKIELNYPIYPVIAGNGFGIRGALFGYFLRFDYAWQVDDRGWHSPTSHLSLGLDF
jgi:hypothetical protein